jgi:hypothetical protein
MSLYVLWTPKKLGKLQFELQIVGAHEAIIAKANVLLDAKKEIRSAAALGPLVLNFQSAGTIKFQLKEPNGQWESILEIPASQAVLPSSPIVVIPSPSTPTH